MNITSYGLPKKLGRLVSHTAILASALLVFVVLSSTLHPASALTTTPTTMNFQGRLTNSSGNIMADGLYNMKFRLYDASTGGTLKWSEIRETTNRVQVTNGLFSVQLGQVTAMDPSVFASGSLYFEIELPTPGTATCSTASCGTFTEGPMSPRNKLSTSAYAYNSETLDGIDSSQFARVDAANTFNGEQLVRADSANAFAVQNTAGADSLVVDTDENKVRVGGGLVVGDEMRVVTDTTYTLGSTTFAPVTLTGGATSLTMDDDELSNAISLPFDFQFYNKRVTDFRIMSNGYITFDSTATSGYSHSLPYVNEPSLVAGYMGDLDPRDGGTIKYQTLGTAPNRVVAIEFSGIHPFGDNTDTIDFQILLYEGSNNIEIHTANAANLAGETNTQGIQSSLGKAANVDSGRNDVEFSLTNDAVRFTYSVPPSFVVSPGDASISGRLTVAERRIDSSDGKFLGVDVNNNTYLGINTLSSNTSGTGNIAIGLNGLQGNTTGSNNIAQGTNSLFSNTGGEDNIAQGLASLYSNTTGSNNLAQGWSSLYSNTSGDFNIAQGNSALFSNTTGSFNIAQGWESLQYNTTGNYNVAQGVETLKFNTAGNYNLAQGYDALYYNSTGSDNGAQGHGSMFANTSGSRNTASGSFSLYLNTTGSYNTTQGYESLRYNTTGSYNTGLGYRAGALDSSGTFKTLGDIQKATAIGAYSQVQKDNTIVLGSVDDATQVVVGATVPIGTNRFGVSPLDYQAGTVTRTNGSAILTGTDVTWTSAMVGDVIIFADGTTNTVAGLNDPTAITMSSSYTGITDASPVYYRFHKPGFQVADTGDTYVANTSSTAFTVQNASGTTSVLGVDTSNNKVQIGSASADVLAVALVLDSYNNGTDPTGVNGAMYYNSNTNKFRCYENGAWADCIGAGGGSGVTTVGSFAGSSIANGASISGNTITFGAADGTNPGMVTTGVQTLAGDKTFTGSTAIKTDAAYAFLVQDALGANTIFEVGDPSGSSYVSATVTDGFYFDAGNTGFQMYGGTSYTYAQNDFGVSSNSYKLESYGGTDALAINAITGDVVWGTEGSFDVPTKLTNPSSQPTNASSTAWNKDSNYLAVTTNSSPYLSLYKRSGNTFTKLTDPASMPGSAAYGAKFSPDGQYLSMGLTSSPYLAIYQRSGDTFTKLANPATLPAGTALSTTWSPDGNYLTVAHTSTPYITTYKRSGNTFTKLADPSVLPQDNATSASWSPDGQYLSVTYYNYAPMITIYKKVGDSIVKIANPASSPGADVKSSSWSPDGKYLTLGLTTSPYIAIYKHAGDIFTKLSNPVATPAGHVNSLAWSPDGKYLMASHFTSPYVTFYTRTDDTFTKLSDPLDIPTSTAYGSSWSPDGRFVAVANSGTTPLIIYGQDSGLTLNTTFNGSLFATGDVNVKNITSTGLLSSQNGLVVNGTTTMVGDVNINDGTLTTSNIEVAAGKSLTITGGNTASRPASPTEGMVYFDTTTKQLLTYSNGKWQADRSTATKTVGTSASGGASGAAASQSPDGADYVNASTTSAQTVINSALTAVGNTGGGTVYLMEGTYVVDASVLIPSKVTLVGAGPGTILKLKNGAGYLTGVVANSDQVNGNSNIAIIDLVIDGNGAGGASGSGIATSPGSGEVSGLTVERTTIRNFGGSGYATEIEAVNSRFSNNKITNNSYGMNIYSNVTPDYAADGWVIDGNSFTGNSNSDLEASLKNSLVTNNTFSDIVNESVTFNTGYGVTFANNSFRDTLTAVALQNITNFTITSNTMVDVGTGVKLYSTADNSTVSNNSISGSTTGIEIDSGSDNNRITENYITGFATAISDSGTGTIYANQQNSSGILTNSASAVKSTAAAAFQVQNATATETLFTANTSSNQVKIGNSTASANADVSVLVLDNAISTYTPTGVAGAMYYDSTNNKFKCYTTAWVNCDTDTDTDTGVNAIGTFSATSIANGASVSGRTLTLGVADGTNPGMVSITTQTIAGDKTLTGNTTLSGITTANGNTLVKTTNANAFAVQNGSSVNFLSVDTSGNKIQVGSATTDATAILFSLDSYNSGTDPTGVAGAMYYNTNLAKYRCYEGGAWKNCITTDTDTDTDTGVNALGSFTGASIAGGASISGRTLTFGAADGTNPGLVTTGAQTLAGDKTLTGNTLVKTTNAGAFQVQNAGATETLFTANTSSNQVKIGNSTAAANADVSILVLDNAISTYTPTGVAGAMYYDSTNNKFKCYTTAWVNCDTDTDTDTGVNAVGTFSATSVANGASISGRTLTLAVADGTNPGMVSTTTQTIAGNKTLTGNTIFSGTTTVNANTLVKSTNASAFAIQDGNAANFLSVDTSGNKIQVGSATTDATAVLFSLDSYNSGTDPTGVAGGMYYNTNLNKFRCYQNGAWTNCITVDTDTDTDTGVNALGAFTGASIAGGASISGRTLTFGAADGTNPGLVTTGTQTFAGDKTLTGNTLVKATNAGAFQVQNAGATETLFTANTSSNQVKIGNSTASANADVSVLVLDNAISTYTPTGVAGAMYYDSTNNKFKCYTTTWVNCDTDTDTDTGVNAIGTFSATSIANGASISGRTLTLGVADGTNPGMLSTTTQTIAGDKTLTGNTLVKTTNASAFAVQNGSNANFFSVDTSGNKLQVGSATTDATAILFSLDSYNSGTDPTGVAGGMYYNTNLNKFRCYQNGAWTNCITVDTDTDTGVTAVGTFAGASIANGASISGNTITFGAADGTNPGLVTTGIQTIAGNKTLTGNTVVNNIEVVAGKTLTVNGDTRTNIGSIASPVEGMMTYDTTNKKLLVYSNGKWQADRSTSTKIVAASNSSQAIKDAADYVADGTGDQTEINNALTAATGGKVYLTEGLFVINDSISVPNTTSLAGSGRGTEIQFANIGVDKDMIANSDISSGKGVVIRDMVLNGRKDINAAGIQNGIVFKSMGVYDITKSGGEISGVMVHNFRNDGIKLASSSTYNKISGNTLKNNNYGLVFNSSSSNTADSNTVMNNVTDGILVTNSATANIINNNTVSNNTGAGITVNSANYVTVSGNYVGSNATGIAFTSSSAYGTISGNNILANSTKGIDLNTATDNNVSGNTLTINGGSTNNNAISLTGADRNTIATNVIYDSTYSSTNYAITITDSASDNNILSGNTLGTGSVNDAGTGTIYANQLNSSGILTNSASAVKSTAAAAFQVQNATATETLFTANTSSNQVKIGNSTASANADVSVLVLDNAISTYTPTGVAGAMYYDSTNNKFKCYTTSWVDCDTDTGVTSVDTFSATSVANGGSVSGRVLTLAVADGTNPGMLSTTTQTIAGDKTLTGNTLIKATNASAFTVQNSGATETLFTANTSNNQVKIGNSTAAANADVSLLVLDSAISTYTPIGTAGATYYDSTNNKFKCYTTSWTDCAGVTSVATFSGSSIANGASISAGAITFGPADGTNPGMVTTGAQTLAGDKTLTGRTLVQPATDGDAFEVNNNSGLNILTVDTESAVDPLEVQIGSSTNVDAVQVNLSLDSSSALADSGTCTTTVNQGSMYYNTATHAIRACVNAAWEDVASTAALGMILFGIVPDSAATTGTGDLAGANGYNSGPCKVYLTASQNVVGWNSCVAYSNGRKNLVAAGTATVSASTSVFQNLCLNTSGVPVLVGTANAQEHTAGLFPTFSLNNPLLCLATIKTGTSASRVQAIYDTRVYTTSTKSPATISNALTTFGLGALVKSNGTIGQYTPMAAVTDQISGVVVAYSGTTSTTTPNAIIVTAGPVAVKATAGTVGQIIRWGSAGGYSLTVAAATTAVNPYVNAGIAMNAYSGVPTGCTASTVCNGSLFTILNPN